MNVNLWEAELQKANGETFKNAAERANDDIEYTKFYKMESERIKEEHKSPEKALEDAQRISASEVPQACHSMTN